MNPFLQETFWPFMFLVGYTYQQFPLQTTVFSSCLKSIANLMIDTSYRDRMIQLITNYKKNQDKLSRQETIPWIYNQYVLLESNPIPYSSIQVYQHTNRSQWGPIFWRMIHILALQYNPVKYPLSCIYFKAFLSSLVYLLPCQICRDHLKINLEQFPIDSYLSSSKRLFYWTFELHNHINQQTHKLLLNYPQVYSHYSNYLNL